MALLEDLIKTIGLNTSFFFQLFLSVALYFVLKKLLFQPYLEARDKRAELTEGRLKKGKYLESQIEESENLYKEKAKKLHKDFQETFSKIKDQAGKNFLKASLQLQTEQKSQLESKRKDIHKNILEQEKLLQKDLPELVQMLAEKIKS